MPGDGHDRLATFIDRREAIALFDHLRGRDPGKPWPFLPILAFIALGGSGKSTLIEYLRATNCCLPDGRAAVPYALLDFTVSGTPVDLLSILVNLRDQLQQHDDGQGRHLAFPRFDLGALVAQAAQTSEDPSSLGPKEIRSRLARGMQAFEVLSTISGALGHTVPFVQPLLAGLKFAGQIKAVQNILDHLENSTGWRWYRMHGTETHLGASASLRDVLLRLHVLSMPGRPERDYLLGSLLPAAFVADLRDALVQSDPPRAWSKTANVVLFLDGFEELQRASATTAKRLLQVLTTEHRKSGETDPLLLVVGERNLLLGLSENERDEHSEQRTALVSTQDVDAYMWERHKRWQTQIVGDRRFLRLKDLYVPLWMRDFADDDMLVRAIDRVTQGHHSTWPWLPGRCWRRMHEGES